MRLLEKLTTFAASVGLLMVFGTMPLMADSPQIFRSVDAQGNVVFSDVPREGAKPVEVQQPSTVSAPPVSAPIPAPAAPKADGKDAFVGYQALVITQPENGAAFNNGAGDVDVSVSIVPPLRTDLGHGLTITMDGKPVLQNSARLNVALNNVDRGEHELQAFVQDASGQVLFISAPSRFSMVRTSIFLPGRANQAVPPGVAPPRPVPLPAPRAGS